MPQHQRLVKAIPALVAAGEACVRLRSSRNPDATVFQTYRMRRFYDCCAAERRLRQLLQVLCDCLIKEDGWRPLQCAVSQYVHGFSRQVLFLREDLTRQVQSALQANPDLLGLSLVFEANALDGKVELPVAR